MLNPGFDSEIVPYTRHRFDWLDVFSHGESGTLWVSIKPMMRPCFTLGLLKELNTLQLLISSHQEAYAYYVLSSEFDGVFSLGGDLEYFHECVTNRDREGLIEYLTLCLKVIHGSHDRRRVERIVLVDGMAIGGAFETALAADTIIAEDGASFYFPEEKYNLFPAMGGYYYLKHRIGHTQTMRIIRSGRVYTAREMWDLGVIDGLVARGHGAKAIVSHINRSNRNHNSYAGYRYMDSLHPGPSYQELLSLGMRWVDSVLSLTDREKALLRRVIDQQNKKFPVYRTHCQSTG